MNRKKGILAAGTLTGLVLATILALGFQGPSNTAAGETAVSPELIVNPVIIPEQGSPPTNEADVQALESYSQQLETALQTMQEREAAYQSQIDTANQTIINLQDQVNAQIDAQTPQTIYVDAPPSPGGGSDYEDGEYEEHEDDDDDHDEYEDDDDHEEHEDDDD